MANAYAESWVRSVVEECLVLILMIHTAHLQRVWLVYITYDYHVSGPPQGIEQLTPIHLGRADRHQSCWTPKGAGRDHQ